MGRVQSPPIQGNPFSQHRLVQPFITDWICHSSVLACIEREGRLALNQVRFKQL